MVAKFKEGKITEGICEAVITAGEQLKVYFPYQTDDVNELPDEISFQERNITGLHEQPELLICNI